MRKHHALLASLSLGLAMCAYSPQTGIMTADWKPPAKSKDQPQKVMIAWESESRITGSMTFTLGRGGQRYVGPYMLIEKTTSHVAAQSLYGLWDDGIYDSWSVTGVNPWFEPGWGVSFWVSHYDGHVVSGLDGNRGGKARCRFTLANTEHGIPGGGTGKCQLSDGGLLDASF
ncbi:MAG: hypothetical protein P8Q97_12770 [Myxococcota bacterium]|jgi:hypothetical protein|nr:hypothetical protein [Myxococcota bacterium]